MPDELEDQWKRKKQTPEQKRAAKMAKLDPDNWKSAKDVMDERSAAAKRKREEEDGSDGEQLVEPELPKVIQDQQLPHSKKRKTDQQDGGKPGSQQNASPNTPISDKKREKLQRQAEKKAAKKEKKQKLKDTPKAEIAQEQDESWVDVDEESNQSSETADAIQIPLNNLEDVEMADGASTATSSNPVSPIMSPTAESGSSSISSIPVSISDQPIAIPQTKSSKKNKLKPEPQNLISKPAAPPTLDASSKAAARARLTEAITSMRTQRKADSNPRSRQELLDQRRRKEEARRQVKKEQRRKEKEEEVRKADEEIERRFSPGGSGSLLGSPRSPPISNSGNTTNGGGNTFSFGRIEFADGTEADTTNLKGLLDKNRKKGPQDINTALQAAKNKSLRLSGLDEQKRKQIQEKDLWLNAKRRAHGERVKDDSSLLKKALKRQEGQKRKSEKEWTDRKDGIQKAQEMKQKKRTENLAKRKDEKKSGKKGKKVKRPGFEGSFRGRSGGKKKR